MSTKAVIQKHGTTAVSAVAIATAMTSMVLQHFWPEGAAVAKKSHESIAPIVNGVSEDVADLMDVLAVERTKRRELARRVHMLEERLMDKEEAVVSRARAIVETPAPEVEAESEVDSPPMAADVAAAIVEGAAVVPELPASRRLTKQVPSFEDLD